MITLSDLIGSWSINIKSSIIKIVGLDIPSIDIKVGTMYVYPNGLSNSMLGQNLPIVASKSTIKIGNVEYNYINPKYDGKVLNSFELLINAPIEQKLYVERSR